MPNTITLDQIERIFAALGPDGQIQFIDHLSRKMDCADGIDTLACAHQYADTQCRWDASDAEREAVVEGVLYPCVTYDAVRPIMDTAEAIAVRVARDIVAVQTRRWAA